VSSDGFEWVILSAHTTTCRRNTVLKHLSFYGQCATVAEAERGGRTYSEVQYQPKPTNSTRPSSNSWGHRLSFLPKLSTFCKIPVSSRA